MYFLFIILLAAMLCLLFAVGMILFEKKICVKYPKRKYVLPLVFIMLHIATVIFIIVIALAAYTSEPKNDVLNCISFDRTDENYEEKVRYYLEIAGIEQPIEGNSDLIEVNLFEDGTLNSLFIYDKNGDVLSTVETEAQDNLFDKIAISPFFVFLSCAFGCSFWGTLVVALLPNKRKVSEAQEMDIMNL